MRLHGHNDTAVQLALQNTLMVQVQQGHRIVTPLHRGFQRPIQEPSIFWERFRKKYPEYWWLFRPLNGASSDPIWKEVPVPQEHHMADTKASQDTDSSDSSPPHLHPRHPQFLTKQTQSKLRRLTNLLNLLWPGSPRSNI